MTSAQGWESDGVTPRLQAQFGYAYDMAWNLNRRINNTLVQIFNVNTLNELTSATNRATCTIAGTATKPEGGYSHWGWPNGVTNVTVSGTGLASGPAALYLDGSWVMTNATLANGNNTYTAIAQDNYARLSTNNVTVDLPSENTMSIVRTDTNGPFNFTAPPRGQVQVSYRISF